MLPMSQQEIARHRVGARSESASHLRRTSSGLSVRPSNSIRVGISRKQMLPPSVPNAAMLPAATSKTTVTLARLAGPLQEARRSG